MRVLLLLAAVVLGCGGPARLESGFAGTWRGTVLVSGGVTTSYPGSLLVTLDESGTLLHVSHLCPNGSGELDAFGVTTAATFDGAQSCGPVEVAGCPSATVTYRSATLTLQPSKGLLDVDATGGVDACGASSGIHVAFRGQK